MTPSESTLFNGLYHAQLEGDLDSLKKHAKQIKAIAPHSEALDLKLGKQLLYLTQPPIEGWQPKGFSASGGKHRFDTEAMYVAMVALYDAGAKPSASGLFIAALQGTLEGFKAYSELFLETGLHLDTPDNFGRSLFLELVNRDHPSNLKKIGFLLQKGADINFQDRQGNTALHMAVSNENPRLIFALARAGARFDIPNHDNQTCIELFEDVYMDPPNGGNDDREWLELESKTKFELLLKRHAAHGEAKSIHKVTANPAHTPRPSARL